MAIAPLMEDEGLSGGSDGPVGGPWPRAVRHVVPAPVAGSSTRGGEKVGAPVRRAMAVRRRRRVLLGALVAGLVTVLALPIGALGGAAPAPRAADAPTAVAAVYVVQPGDTLWSIASRFDRGGDPRPLAEAIAQETGSANVVPGERIAIP